MNKYDTIKKIISEQYRPADYTGFSVTQYMVEMPDGIKLRTQVSIPDGAVQPLPVILSRSPYGENALRFFYELSLYGYICVFQDCRGCYGSEGNWEPHVNERADGLATLDWIISQKWCDGNIGLTGESYLSLTQWLMADKLPKEVKTLNIEVFNPYRHMQLYSDGMFKLEAYTGWTAYNVPSPLKISKDELYEKAINFSPQINMDKALFGKDLPWYRDWVSNPDENSNCWHDDVCGNLEKMPEKLSVPTLFRGGWYDPHIEGMFKAYENIPSETRDESIFIITPLNHRGTLSSDLKMDNVFDFVGTRFIKTKLMWFDCHLKGKDLNPYLKKGHVYAYILGENKWIDLQHMPTCTRKLKLFMDFKNNSLTEKIHENSTASYEYDPANPVSTCGSDVVMIQYMYQQNPKPIHGIRKQPDKNTRADVITLESATLDNDIFISGSIKVHLFVSSSAEDTAFTAKLCFVLPDGSAYHIRNSITTLNRNVLAKCKYTKNAVTEIELSFFNIFFSVKKGQKLRLDISSSDFPAFNNHTNTLENWAEAAYSLKAQQNLFSGGDFISYVEIPTV